MTKNSNSNPQQPLFGFRPSLATKIYRKCAKVLIRLLHLNNGAFPFSIELSQQLRPSITSKYNGKNITWHSPNGRLAWRAKTVLTEEPLLIEWINESFDRNTVFLDIGANVGSYSIYAATRQVKQVYSCELDFLNLSILYGNIIENNLNEKILILPFPAASSTKIVEVFFRDMSAGDALQSINRKSPMKTINSTKAHSLKMMAFPLDDIFISQSLLMPTHIKIDVDGNELEVVMGMEKILANARMVYFETSQAVEKDCNECLRLMYRMGYKIKDNSAIYSKLSTDSIVVGSNLLLERE